MLKNILIFALSLAAPVAPAAAVTLVYDFAGASSSAAGYTFVNGYNSATLTPLLYRVMPTQLTSTSQFVSTDSFTNLPFIVRELNGVSVSTASEDNNASERGQIDTSGGTNELLKISMTGSSRITAAVFTYVNSTDSLRIYGNNDGDTTLNYLGFNNGDLYTSPGVTHSIGSGTGGATATATDPSGTLTDNTAITVIFSNLPVYQNYYLTSNADSNDGYALRAIQVVAVPEVSSWAMMLVGFGAVGGLMRVNRRKLAIV